MMKSRQSRSRDNLKLKGIKIRFEIHNLNLSKLSSLRIKKKSNSQVRELFSAGLNYVAIIVVSSCIRRYGKYSETYLAK